MIDKKIINMLIDILGKDKVKTEEIENYSHDETKGIENVIPDVVVYPTSAQEISKIMKIANRYKIPVTPRGAGTGLSGGAVPVHRGIVLSLERMNKIIEFDPDNFAIVVEPGVITSEIQKIAQDHGLYYAGDPASSESSSIGGNVAENAGGMRVIKYGPTGFHVIGIEAVLPTGEIVNFGGKMYKNVMGYDLIRLFVGSEGTLGIITKITLRLIPKPRYFAVLLAPFEKLENAIFTVPKILSESGIFPSAIEFMDRYSLIFSEKFLNETFPYRDSEAFLILEVDANSKKSLMDSYIKIGDKLMENKAKEVFIADNHYQAVKIWRIRKAIAEGLIAFKPDHNMEDVSVPISSIPELVKYTYDIAKNNQIEVLNFGHIGDGNVHVTFLKPNSMNEKEWEKTVKRALLQLYEKTKQFGGSITGEHGVGLKRKKYLEIFYTKEEIEIMKKIKKAFDPNGILNPGKIFP